MSIKKRNNLTKKDINKIINLKTGLPLDYINKITEDLIFILKKNIPKKQISIKNFVTFKTINKKERMGRNPKNNESFIITARRTLSLTPSKFLNNKINNS